MTELEKTIESLQKRNSDLENEMSSTTQRLDAIVAKHTEQLAMLSDTCRSSDMTHKAAPVPNGRPDTYTQFTSFACTSDIITVSCPTTSRTIFVTSAYYGKYHDLGSTCVGCCPPVPSLDCTVDIEAHRPSDWLAIKALCDNQTSCQLENFGFVIDECEVGYTSDYVQIFFDCYPVDETGPVGFTALATTGTATAYTEYDVVVFDLVTINFGGHYNADTSSFVCPYEGAYIVSVNILASASSMADAGIMQNDLRVAKVYADDQSGVYNQASNTAVVECQRGDVLWVQSGASTTLLYAANQHCTFTAFLLHRL